MYAPLFENTDNYKFIAGTESLEKYKTTDDKSVFAILSITDNLLDNPKAATLYSEKQIPGELSRIVNQTLSRYLENAKMATYNIPNLKEIIKESQIKFEINTVKWSEDGGEKLVLHRAPDDRARVLNIARGIAGTDTEQAGAAWV